MTANELAQADIDRIARRHPRDPSLLIGAASERTETHSRSVKYHTQSAYNAAISRLKKLHKAEFDSLYEEAKAGVSWGGR